MRFGQMNNLKNFVVLGAAFLALSACSLAPFPEFDDDEYSLVSDSENATYEGQENKKKVDAPEKAAPAKTKPVIVADDLDKLNQIFSSLIFDNPSSDNVMQEFIKFADTIQGNHILASKAQNELKAANLLPSVMKLTDPASSSSTRRLSIFSSTRAKASILTKFPNW